MTKTLRILSVLWISAIILFATLPMGLSPRYNGEDPQQRNQYELMAESLLKGHLYLDLPVTEKLKAMENPYDPAARKEIQPGSYWDHAYYNEHYYMYFGVVPAIILFLPYRVITGHALTTYHATQLFTAFIIIGFFILFDFIRKKLYPAMSHFIYMALSTAFSLASVWYFTTAPALYCTAISSAVAMMIWSIYFYFYVFWTDLSPKKETLYLTIGALLGALTFGCRPPVALANIAMVFILYKIIKKNRKNIIPIALPYVIVGILLMLYNYARFDNPFEFGQAYQLTVADQRSYSLFSNISFLRIVNSFIAFFLRANSLTDAFPYVVFNGILIEFPIFIIGLGYFFFSENTRESLRKKQLLSTTSMMLVSVGIITYSIIAMSPLIYERYHTDFYFLFSIFTFIIISARLRSASSRQKPWLNTVLICFSVLTSITAVLLFFIPYDANWTQYYPEILEAIQQFLSN